MSFHLFSGCMMQNVRNLAFLTSDNSPGKLCYSISGVRLPPPIQCVALVMITATGKEIELDGLIQIWLGMWQTLVFGPFLQPT